MEPVIYVDVLFIINFIINLTLLKITLSLIKRKVCVSRMLISAFTGAVYAVCMFFPNIGFLYIFPVKISVSVIMVIIVSPKCSCLRIIKSVAVFFVVSFTFAGVLLALIYFTGFASNNTAMSNGIFYFNISAKQLIAASLISYSVIFVSTAFFRRNKLLGIKKMKIYLGNNECEINALSDTGNMLCDPISNNPVIIVEKNHIESLFPEGVPSYELNPDIKVKLRLIPYTSVGKAGGLLTGFVPDMVTVDGIKTKETIIAIAENVLSPGDEYNALFNPNIITVKS